MTRLKKILIAVAAMLVIAVIAAGLFVRSVARRGLPDYGTDIALDNMKGVVTVYRDAHAVPHIYAVHEDDLYRATGWVMAQDRLWQMDLLRRATSGRLSEIFGKDLVDADLLLRALKFPEKSRRTLEKTNRKITRALEAFSDGVNQYIRKNGGNLPPEFIILGYRPEEWKPEHSLNLIGYMAWDLCEPWPIEMALHKVKLKVDAARFRDLIPDMKKYTSVAFPGFARGGADFGKGLFAGQQRIMKLGIQAIHGSNNWAVSGSRSSTGKPILANDMHLNLFAPGIWYQVHLVAGNSLDVTGVAVPGAPFVVAGHNTDIAWGMTNLMVDDLDLYLEKTNPKNPDQYHFNGQWKNMEVRTEKIGIGGGAAVEKKIRFTHRGAVVSEFKGVRDQVISMRWTGYLASNEISGIYKLNRARNWNEFRDAVRNFSSVSLNINYADKKGNIGMQCAGGVPMRPKGDGTEVYPGWTAEYDWLGLVPFERLPFLYNPPTGTVASANNNAAGPGFPYVISHWFDPPYRMDRIIEMLNAKRKHSIDDFKAMHNDVLSHSVRFVKPIVIAALAKAGDLSDLEKKSIELLKAWDDKSLRDSAAPLIFDAFFLEFAKNIFADEMGGELYAEFSGSRTITDIAVRNLLLKKESPWFDDIRTTDKKEGMDDIIRRAFASAVAKISDKHGSDPSRWKWGDAHRLVLNHPMGRVAILDFLFKLNRGPWRADGSFHTVNAAAPDFNTPYDIELGVSQRHIYNLADWDASYTVIPTGNSGIPASDYYCDQAPLLVEGNYHPDFMSEGKIRETAKYVMRINAGNK